VASAGRPVELSCQSTTVPRTNFFCRFALCQFHSTLSLYPITLHFAQSTTAHPTVAHMFLIFGHKFRQFVADSATNRVNGLQKQADHDIFNVTKDKAATPGQSAPKLLFCFQVTEFISGRTGDLSWGRCPQTPDQRQGGNAGHNLTKVAVENSRAGKIETVPCHRQLAGECPFIL